MRHKDLYVENFILIVEIKKITRFKTANLNPPYKIKLHKFT